MFPQLGPGADCGIHKDLVEHRSPWRVSFADPLRRRWTAPKCEITYIVIESSYGRASGRSEPLKEAPSLKPRDTRLMNEVRGQRQVARKLRPIEQQYAVSLASQQHR